MYPGTGNPFLDDVFVEHEGSLPGVPGIHGDLFDSLVETVESLAKSRDEAHPSDWLGRTVLLTAPRAGYGKTHLAARLDREIRPIATPLRLALDPARPITWPVVLHSLLRQIASMAAIHEAARSLLEETGRFLLGELILRQRGGERPEGQPVGDTEITRSFSRLFSPGDESGMLTWVDEHSGTLCDRADESLLEVTGLRRSELGFWTHLLIDLQHRGDAALAPLRGLSNGEARERLLQLLRIHAFHRPLVLVADGLDGFFRSEEAGLEIANLLTSIRERVPRSISLLCLNDDVWESVFQSRLPTAWLDRLSGESETLRPISSEAAEELIRSRLARTSIEPAEADAFVEQWLSNGLAADPEMVLSPRTALRLARELWDKREERSEDEPSGESLSLSLVEENDETPSNGTAPDLAQLTGKPALIQALPDPTPPAAPAPKPPPIPLAKPELAPAAETTAPAAGEENPFFVGPARETAAAPRENLAGIESIIAEIRGTGKTVASDSPAPQVEERSEPIEAGDLRLRFGKQSPNPTAARPASLLPVEAAPEEPPVETAPVSRREIEQQLRDEESTQLAAAPLALDLERVATLLRRLGSAHGGLGQTEEHFPSSRLPCLRWVVRSHSVVIGFESPANVYFWNNLLQQALSSSDLVKISAFSHSSQPFDPDLFSGFGFSPAVIRSHVDVIEMGDRELSMLHAAETLLDRYANRGEASVAKEVITLYLDPLWRRISRPL